MNKPTKRTNPIDFVLTTKYNSGKRDLKRFYNKCFDGVDALRTNRGAQEYVSSLLETDYPGFTDHFPLKGWKQKKLEPDGSYSYTIVDKEFEDSLNIYCKKVTENVRKFGRRAQGKSHKDLSDQLNIPSFVSPDPDPEPVTNEEVSAVKAYREMGATSLKTPNGWEIQF